VSELVEALLHTLEADSQVRSDDAVLGREGGDLVTEDLAVAREARNEHKRRAFSRVDDRDALAARKLYENRLQRASAMSS
jgi:hypothetical protein